MEDVNSHATRQVLLWYLGQILVALSDPNTEIEDIKVDVEQGMRDTTKPTDTAKRREMDGTRHYVFDLKLRPVEVTVSA